MEIWPFGHTDADDNPVPRVALAFRNQRLEALLEDTSEESLAGYLETILDHQPLD